MNHKGPWEGYRRQAKRRLARCLLPAFLCAQIFIERETFGYEAGAIRYDVRYSTITYRYVIPQLRDQCDATSLVYRIAPKCPFLSVSRSPLSGMIFTPAQKLSGMVGAQPNARSIYTLMNKNSLPPFIYTTVYELCWKQTHNTFLPLPRDLDHTKRFAADCPPITVESKPVLDSGLHSVDSGSFCQ